ncbi:membrane protein [Arthrobacter sp. StoSoilB13]|nr:membrane protein [Arthrobacter sp. StoSoilB13]
MARARQRWLPALLVPLALALAALIGSVQAGASVSLPPKTADEILAMIARTEVRALSGTVVQTADLGLPEIPTAGPGIVPGATSALELLTGSHTARIYLDGPSKAKLQILDRMAERDFVVNGGDAWFYNSADNSATHLSVPVPSLADRGKSLPTESTRPDIPTPEAMARHFLSAIDSSTEVTVGEASTVAGRSAYRLSLVPRSDGTLVDSLSINVDSETGLPLGVEVRAKGQPEPAYSLAYTEVNFSTPDAALFNFTPPAGATVTEKPVPMKPVPMKPMPPEMGDPAVPAPDEPVPTPGGSSIPVLPRPSSPSVTGEGWDTVIGLPAGTAPADLTSNPQLAQALQPVNGGRALTTAPGERPHSRRRPRVCRLGAFGPARISRECPMTGAQ